MVIVRGSPRVSLFPNGTYTLMKCAGTLTADVANMTLEYPAQTGTLTLGVNAGAKEIYLTVTGVSSSANLTWLGNLSAAWDLGTAKLAQGQCRQCVSPPETTSRLTTRAQRLP